MEKKNVRLVVILLVVAIAVIVVLGSFGIGGFNLFGSAAPVAQNAAQTPAQTLLAQVQQSGSVSQLETADIAAGTGDPIVPGDTISVNYVGALPGGTVFDSTAAHGGTPLTLVVAPDGSLHTPDGGNLIAGWSQGIAGMKEGGERLLVIPPSLGYGAVAQGSIPANSTLIFDIQIAKVTHAGASSAPAAAPVQTQTAPAQ